MATPDQVTPAGGLSAARSVRNGAVYATAAAFQRALTFLLLPLYTHALSPSEYGRLGVILMVTTAGAILFSLGLDFALFRNFFQLASDPSGQRRLVSSTWSFLIVASLGAACVLSAVIAPWLPPDAIVRPTELTVGLVGAALFICATTVPLSLLRAQQRLRDYLVLNAISAGATTTFTLALVVGFEMGVPGWLLAVLLANLVAVMSALWIVPWRWPRPFDQHLVRGTLLLGLPLVPHFLGHWALQLADRAVLAGIVSTATLGVYTLAATLSLPALILVQGLGQGFMPTYAAAATSDVERSRLPSVVTLQVVGVLVICLVIALLGPALVDIAAPAAYHGAAPLIPWIVLGYAFLGLYGVPMMGLSLGMGRTQFVWMATAVAAAVNLALVYALVPAYGILAAAIASAIGYLMLLLGVGWHSRSPLNPVRYEWSRLLRAVAVVAAVYTAATLTTGDTGIVNVLARVAWLGVAAGGLVLSRSVPVDRIRAVVARRRLA